MTSDFEGLTLKLATSQSAANCFNPKPNHLTDNLLHSEYEISVQNAVETRLVLFKQDCGPIIKLQVS